MKEIPATARTKYDPRTHATFDTGMQTLTKCGRRVTWLNINETIDPGTGTVDCEECLKTIADGEAYRARKQAEANGSS